jgi:hypothetical protein
LAADICAAFTVNHDSGGITMKKAIVCAVVLMLALSSVVLAQDSKTVTSFSPPKAIRVPFHEPAPSYFYVPNEMVLKLGTNGDATNELSIRPEENVMLTGNSKLDELNRKFGVTRFVREFPDNGEEVADAAGVDLSKYYLLKFNEKFKLEEVRRAYEQCGEVEGTEAIGVHPVYESIPDDPRFLTDQWNFYSTTDHDVDATDAWDLETGDDAVLLGDLDTGLQYNSGDLGGLAPYTAKFDDDGNGFEDDWIGWDFVDNITGAWPGEDADEEDNEPTDFNGHGTHVGGIMGAITNNGNAVAGLAGGWNTGPSDPANGVSVMALRIGWSAPHPLYPWIEVGYVRMDFAAQAMYYATNKGATAVQRRHCGARRRQRQLQLPRLPRFALRRRERLRDQPERHQGVVLQLRHLGGPCGSRCRHYEHVLQPLRPELCRLDERNVASVAARRGRGWLAEVVCAHADRCRDHGSDHQPHRLYRRYQSVVRWAPGQRPAQRAPFARRSYRAVGHGDSTKWW